MARKTPTQKRIEKRGWTVSENSKGFKATKGSGKTRLVVTGNTLSEVRFLIRFEKFYSGRLINSGNLINWDKKKGWVK